MLRGEWAHGKVICRIVILKNLNKILNKKLNQLHQKSSIVKHCYTKQQQMLLGTVPCCKHISCKNHQDSRISCYSLFTLKSYEYPLNLVRLLMKALSVFQLSRKILQGCPAFSLYILGFQNPSFLTVGKKIIVSSLFVMPLALPRFTEIVTHRSGSITTDFWTQFPKILMTLAGPYQLRRFCDSVKILPSCALPQQHTINSLYLHTHRKLASYTCYNSTSPEAENGYYSSHCFPSLSSYYSNTLFLKAWWKVLRKGLSFLLNSCFCQPFKTSKKYKAGVTENILRLTVRKQLLLGMILNIYSVCNN